MKNIQNEKQDIDNSNKQEKLEWQVPELTVISMDQTNSGTFFIVPAMEGTFYSPS